MREVATDFVAHSTTECPNNKPAPIAVNVRNDLRTWHEIDKPNPGVGELTQQIGEAIEVVPCSAEGTGAAPEVTVLEVKHTDVHYL